MCTNTTAEAGSTGAVAVWLGVAAAAAVWHGTAAGVVAVAAVVVDVDATLQRLKSAAVVPDVALTTSWIVGAA